MQTAASKAQRAANLEPLLPCDPGRLPTSAASSSRTPAGKKLQRPLAAPPKCFFPAFLSQLVASLPLQGLSEFPLPEMELHGEVPLASLAHPRGEVSVASAPSEALTSLREAVDELRRLDFENVLRNEGRREAKDSLQQFAQGLHLVTTYHPEELQAGRALRKCESLSISHFPAVEEVDRLQPKHPMLRFLMLAQEEFSREQALQALRQLLTTPQLSKWREALEDDRELLEAAVASRLLGGTGDSPISGGASRTGASDYESAESDEERVPSPLRAQNLRRAGGRLPSCTFFESCPLRCRSFPKCRSATTRGHSVLVALRG